MIFDDNKFFTSSNNIKKAARMLNKQQQQGCTARATHKKGTRKGEQKKVVRYKMNSHWEIKIISVVLLLFLLFSVTVAIFP